MMISMVLVQERCNSIANAMELCLSCTNPSIWWDSAVSHGEHSHLRRSTWWLLMAWCIASAEVMLDNNNQIYQSGAVIAWSSISWYYISVFYLTTQLALRRWPNVGPTSTLTLGQRRLTNVGPTWICQLAQRWPNGCTPTLAQRCANIGPTLAH